MNLDDLCFKVCRAHARCKDSQQLLNMRQWVWDLSMRVVYQLAQVCAHTYKQMYLPQQHLLLLLLNVHDLCRGLLPASCWCEDVSITGCAYHVIEWSVVSSNTCTFGWGWCYCAHAYPCCIGCGLNAHREDSQWCNLVTVTDLRVSIQESCCAVCYAPCCAVCYAPCSLMLCRHSEMFKGSKAIETALLLLQLPTKDS